MCVFALMHSGESLGQSAWSGALKGLADAAGDIAQQELDRQRVLDQERQRLHLIQEREQRESEQRANQMRQQEEQRRLQEQRRQIEARAAGVTGSGFFVSVKGYVVTNWHVVRDFGNVFVRDQAGKVYKAKLVASDQEADLALLLIARKSTGLRIVGTEAGLKGEEVFAIGYPMPGLQGQESKFTNGIVSSLSGIRGKEQWLQISAPIQGGNSGGPLLNRQGDVVGVVVASVDAARLFKTTGDLPQNVNYAIKSDALLNFLRASAVPNTVARATGAFLRHGDENTVLIIAKDGEFSGAYEPSPDQQPTLSTSDGARAIPITTFRQIAAADDLQVAKVFPNWQSVVNTGKFGNWLSGQDDQIKKPDQYSRLPTTLYALCKFESDQGPILERSNSGTGVNQGAIVDTLFPGWRNTVNTDRFRSWHRKQPRAVLDLAASPRADDAACLLARYSIWERTAIQ